MKKLSCLICAVALALAPATAFAEVESEIQTQTETFTWVEGESEPVVPDTLTLDGVEWELHGVSVTEDASYVPDTKTWTKSESATFATLEEAYAAYPESIDVEQDGFAGEALRTVFEYEAQYAVSYTDVDTVVEYGPYPENEYRNAAIAKTYTIAYTDDEGTKSAAIPWSSAEWRVTSNAAGMPAGYICAVTYRGGAEVYTATGYTVHVEYEGTLTSTAKGFAKVVTYELPAPVKRAPENIAAIVGLTGALAAIVGSYFFFPIFLKGRKNVVLRDTQDTRTRGKCRGKKNKDGVFVITVPPYFNLEKGALLLLDKAYADGSAVVIRQCNLDCWTTTATDRILMPCALPVKK